MPALIVRIALWALLGAALPVSAQTATPDTAQPVAAPATPLPAPGQSAAATGSGSQAVVPGSVFSSNPVKPVSGPSFAPMGYALAFVLALIAGAVWLLRRSGLAPLARNSQILSVAGQLPLGPRERVVVVEIEGRWLVVGISPSGMTRLASMPKGTSVRPGAMSPEPGLQVPAPFAALVERLRKSGTP